MKFNRVFELSCFTWGVFFSSSKALKAMAALHSKEGFILFQDIKNVLKPKITFFSDLFYWFLYVLFIENIQSKLIFIWLGENIAMGRIDKTFINTFLFVQKVILNKKFKFSQVQFYARFYKSFNQLRISYWFYYLHERPLFGMFG